MINKSKLWFLTLSSLILVLMVYYMVVPADESNMVFASKDEPVVTIKNADSSVELTALKVAKEEQTVAAMAELQTVLLNEKSSITEKNDAYEQIKNLNDTAAMEEKIENLLNNSFNITTFVEIKNGSIKVIAANVKESYKMANDIINTINKELNERQYIVVKFQ